MSWTLFNDIYVKRKNELLSFDSSLSESKLTSQEYLPLFFNTVSESYNKFVSKNKKAFEEVNNNFVIDFEPFEMFPDNSGYAAFWVQPVNPGQYYPKKGPFEKILIEGVKFEIRWFEAAQIINGVTHPVFQYDICGWFHPETWGGRNKLNYSPIGKVTFCGFDRIVCEKYEFSDRALTRAINQDFACHFYKCLSYYFL
jgi:hypothetical protein